MKTYSVKETFRTIQGEGYWTGTPALFIRLAGCNMWSGSEEHRGRDAQRNEAECPRWCDTDFVGGEKMTAVEIAAIVAEAAMPMVVISGGEPLLQVDDALLDAIHEASPHARVAIETNGTTHPKFTYAPAAAVLVDAALSHDIEPHEVKSWLWVTLSPKQARDRVALNYASELKLVYPAYDYAKWEDFPADHYYLQPEAQAGYRDEGNEQETAALVRITGGKWRLSLQTHKILGVP